MSTSIWKLDFPLPGREPLRRDLTVDVCVVGAGIAGLTTAYLLSKNHRVVVLDDGPVAGGETERTTAHLSSVLDDRYFELASLHGADGARIAAESHTEAIRRIEEIARAESIDCGFERLDGYLFAPPGADGTLLTRELEAALHAGLSVRLVERAPMPLFDSGPALVFAEQAQMHPLRYVAGLVRAIERAGGEIHTGTRVTQVEGGDRPRVETRDGRTVTARAVVVAANTPFNDRVAIHTKQAAYRTYAIAARVAPGSVPRALYWDVCEGGDTPCDAGAPYHYVRLSSGTSEELLIAGAEDHKTGQSDDAEERFERLLAWTRERFPIGEVAARWSGQVMEPVDALAFIGRDPGGDQNVYVATGDSGNGMTHGTIAGMLLTDLIEGRESPWESLYSPSRKTLSAAAGFAKENVNVAMQYADWVTPGELGSADELRPGEGAVLRRGLSKIAAHRDEHGVVHELSAVCPHLGCIVRWNSFETSWDCPCHGSRFDAKGGLLNGPAASDLTPVEEPVTAGAAVEEPARRS